MDAATLISYRIEEQQAFSAQQRDELHRMGLDFRQDGHEVRYLGLNPYDYNVSYYIGIDWLKAGESYIAVYPKIRNVDYIAMFLHCLDHPETSRFMDEVYHINFSREPIRTETDRWDLTPFIVIHFLSVVDRIVTKGLMRNYKHTDENLQGRLKGKIVWQNHIGKNLIPGRRDRVYCRYQEYTVDCIENALLKKTLLFVQRYTARYKEKYPQLIRKQNSLLDAFHGVSEEVSLPELKHMKRNKLFGDYTEAIALARRILNRFGFSVNRAVSSTEDFLPPFWIDMAKLFELYAYSKLKDAYGSEILFQSKGSYGYTDFLKCDEKLVIDAKYKKTYRNEYCIEDIRQLSGYARDVGIRKRLGVSSESENIDCVIVYPNRDFPDDFSGRSLKETAIGQFTRIFKCGIRLPVKG